MVGYPEVYVHSVENSEQGETPRDTVNDGAVAVLGELVDDGTEEQNVNNSPMMALNMACFCYIQGATHQMRKAHGAGVM